MIVRQSSLKVCRECGVQKPEEDFYRRTDGALRGTCKLCWVAASRRRQKADPARHAAYARASRARDPLSHRIANAKLKYEGITREWYEAQLLIQDNTCPGCGLIFDKTPHIDHDHITGKIRGLLCGGCNRAIGQARESAATLRRLADYIESA